MVTPLVVATGRVNRHDVGLTAEIYKMGQFVVAGEREGNAQAITLQRLSSGIKNVVSTDAFGDLAGNPAELLVRLPGVEGETQDGDVRVVRIRGVNQNLTSITMDGNRLPDASNVGGNREFTFQTVSSETFERMEVVKSPTPDMAGDSIGGAVNMVSKSGFDSSAGRRVRLSYGATWRPFDSRPTRAPRNYTLSYSEVFGGKLAVALNVGYRGIYNPQDVVTQLHEAVPNGSSAPGYTYSVAFNDSREEQCRQGGGLRLDYKLSDATRFFFNTNLTKNIEHQGDRYATFSTNQVVATRDAAGNLTGTGGIIPGYTENLTQVRQIAASTLAMRSYTAYKQGKTTTYQLGGVHLRQQIDRDSLTPLPIVRNLQNGRPRQPPMRKQNILAKGLFISRNGRIDGKARKFRIALAARKDERDERRLRFNLFYRKLFSDLVTKVRRTYLRKRKSAGERNWRNRRCHTPESPPRRKCPERCCRCCRRRQRPCGWPAARRPCWRK